MSLSTDISRGNKAAQELEETEAAFEAVKAAILKALCETSPTQVDKILKLHVSVQHLEAVRLALQMTVSNGLHAANSRAAEDAIAVAGLTRP